MKGSVISHVDMTLLWSPCEAGSNLVSSAQLFHGPQKMVSVALHVLGMCWECLVIMLVATRHSEPHILLITSPPKFLIRKWSHQHHNPIVDLRPGLPILAFPTIPNQRSSHPRVAGILKTPRDATMQVWSTQLLCHGIPPSHQTLYRLHQMCLVQEKHLNRWFGQQLVKRWMLHVSVWDWIGGILDAPR